MARKPSEKKRSLTDAMLFVHGGSDDTSKPVKKPPATPGAASEAPKPYSVRQLVDLLNQTLSTIDGGRRIQVIGEVGSARLGDHWYFSLKDGSKAKIECSFFAQRRRLDPDAATPVVGSLVIATGQLEYWDQGGRLSLIVNQLREAGEGDLHRRFERLKTELNTAGYFDPAARLRLPSFPRRILMITSREGAARRDVEETARQRWPGLQILMHHVAVQGTLATPRIAAAIRKARAVAASLDIDAIVLTRGGGSLEDLWCFNERAVADAIFESRRIATARHLAGGPPPVPLISAIGHETDLTIADLVADHRTSTPTQAAMALVPDANEHRGILTGRAGRMRLLIERRWGECGARLEFASRHEVLRRPDRLLIPHRERIDGHERRLKAAIATQRVTQLARLERSGTRLERVAPKSQLAVASTALEAASDRLARAMRRRLAELGTSLNHAAQRLSSISPDQVLSRGYSLTLGADGRPIRSAAQLRDGDTVTTRLAAGDFDSEVVAIRPSEDADPS